MMFLIYLIIFVFGLALGSFLNCFAYRIEVDKSVVKGRSFCPKCKHQLSWQDLIPLASFVFLRGKCQYCKKPISWQYPAVELATGILLIFNFKFLILNQLSIISYQGIIYSIYLVAISACLIIIFIYDLKHYLIPDKIVFPAIGVALAYRLYQSLVAYSLELIAYSLLAAFLASLFFFLLWAISKGKWLGFGDVKLVFLLGLFVGWPNILVALFSSFLIGAIIGLILIALHKKGIKSEVPFGPFLITGAFLGLFWGQQLISWYLNLIH